jgi:uncharacterized protein YndB with AHSA1/START domain
MTDTKRAADVSLEIAASIEDVWRALTDPQELRRWFPLDATVTPGEGGRMFLSWGDAWMARHASNAGTRRACCARRGAPRGIRCRRTYP